MMSISPGRCPISATRSPPTAPRWCRSARRKRELLEQALGTHAERVTFADMEQVGRNPACIIPVWRDFLSQAGSGPLVGVGEPVWPGRSDAELAECSRHESLINLAFGGGRGVAPAVPVRRGDARRRRAARARAATTRCSRADSESWTSDDYEGPRAVLARPDSLPAPTDRTTELAVRRGRARVGAPLRHRRRPPRRMCGRPARRSRAGRQRARGQHRAPRRRRRRRAHVGRRRTRSSARSPTADTSPIRSPAAPARPTSRERTRPVDGQSPVRSRAGALHQGGQRRAPSHELGVTNAANPHYSGPDTPSFMARRTRREGTKGAPRTTRSTSCCSHPRPSSRACRTRSSPPRPTAGSSTSTSSPRRCSAIRAMS